MSGPVRYVRSLSFAAAAWLAFAAASASASAQSDAPSAAAIAKAKLRAVDTIAAGIAVQRAAKKPILPDKAAIATELRLEMRLNVERLKTVFRSYRKYPEDKDFDRFAVVAQRLIRRYVFTLGSA